MLDAAPHAGRLFTSQEQEVNADVVVLGHGFWRQRWGSDPAVAGRLIRNHLVRSTINPASGARVPIQNANIHLIRSARIPVIRRSSLAST